jgi:predicted DNA-binding protein
MKRTNVWFGEDHPEKFKALSEKTGALVSALLREVIEAYVKKRW